MNIVIISIIHNSNSRLLYFNKKVGYLDIVYLNNNAMQCY